MEDARASGAAIDGRQIETYKRRHGAASSAVGVESIAQRRHDWDR